MMRSISSKACSREATGIPIPIVSVGLLLILTITVFTPILSVAVQQPFDYGLRLQFAQMTLAGETIPPRLATPNVLFDHLLIFLHQTFPVLNWEDAALLVALVATVGASLRIYGSIVEGAGVPAAYRAGALYAGTALTALLVTPITLFTPHNLYFGYIAINIYHSPSMTLLKPLALALFWCALRVFDPLPLPHPGKWLLLSIIVSVLSAMAKPSYSVVIVPALLVAAICRRWMWQAVHWPRLIGGIIAPTVAAVGLQALSYPVGSVIVAPLAVFNAWAMLFNREAAAWLLPKFVLSILFPLIIYCLYLDKAKRSFSLNFAWLCFGIGAAYTYVLAESQRVEFGNFTWSGQITLFILFVVSLLFFVQQNRWLFHVGVQRAQTARFLLGIAILALHVVSGIVWYQAHASGMSTLEMQTSLW